MSVTPLDRPGPWTLEQLVEYEDDLHRYEIVDGALVVNPRPTAFHQAVCRRLFLELERQRSPEWEAIYEVALRMTTSDRVPDLALVRAGTPTPRSLLGYEPADLGLVVEVVSSSSRAMDRVLKPLEYATAGIGWYWRVEIDPVVEVIAFELVDGDYLERARLAGEGVVPGPVPLVLDTQRLAGD